MTEHYSSRAGRESTSNEAPAFRGVPSFDLLSGPQLNTDTLEEFVVWSAMVPISHVEVVRRRVSKSASDDGLVDRLLEELWKLPVVDVGRHRVILSILGELRNERALARLEEFVWFEGELTVAQPDHDASRSCSFEPNGKDMLQARAAEMLSYLGSSDAGRATLKIARDHPSVAVRAAAIDAHSFNNDDSREAAEELLGTVQDQDRPLVGLPRMTRDGDSESFERAVLEWYDRNPEHRPPAPSQSFDLPPQARSWFRARQDHDEGRA